MSIWRFLANLPDEEVYFDGTTTILNVEDPLSPPDPLPPLGTKVQRRLFFMYHMSWPGPAHADYPTNGNAATLVLVTGPGGPEVDTYGNYVNDGTAPVVENAWLAAGTKDSLGNWATVTEDHPEFTTDIYKLDNTSNGSNVASYIGVYSRWRNWDFDEDAAPLSLYFDISPGHQVWRNDHTGPHPLGWLNPTGYVDKTYNSSPPFYVEMRYPPPVTTRPRVRVYPRDDLGRIYPPPTTMTAPGRLTGYR